MRRSRGHKGTLAYGERGGRPSLTVGPRSQPRPRVLQGLDERPRHCSAPLLVLTLLLHRLTVMQLLILQIKVWNDFWALLWIDETVYTSIKDIQEDEASK